MWTETCSQKELEAIVGESTVWSWYQLGMFMSPEYPGYGTEEWFDYICNNRDRDPYIPELQAAISHLRAATEAKELITIELPTYEPTNTQTHTFCPKYGVKSWLESKGRELGLPRLMFRVFAPAMDQSPANDISDDILDIEDRLSRLRSNQKDRLFAREIARQLWKADKSLSISDVAAHERMDLLLQGAYTLKTRAEWIRDLDPRPNHKRRGPKRGRATESV